MNLDILKQHIRAVTQYDWCGQPVFLRKIGAKDGIELFSRIKSLAGEERSPEDDRMQTVSFHADVISKSLADESGELLFDSDEGREALKAVNFQELTELGTLALKHSGYGGEAKKNLPQSESSPTDSASNSDSGPTQTNS